MKKIYQKYCNDNQNPALGAYIIATFVKSFCSVNKCCPTIVDVFIILPIIIVESTRKLINGEHKIRKIKTLYKKIKETSTQKENLAMGLALSSIKNYKEFTMCSLIFALETKMIKFNHNYDIEINKYKEYNNVENMELIDIFEAAKILGYIYAKDYNVKQLISNLGGAI